MNGQNWLQGDRKYHSELKMKTLLVYGVNDKLVTMEEEVEMIDVGIHMIIYSGNVFYALIAMLTFFFFLEHYSVLLLLITFFCCCCSR